MKIIYTIRANKPTVDVEISLKDMFWLLLGRELEVQTHNENLVFKQPFTYALFNLNAPRAE
jgi:hypothetical protein